MLVIMFAGLALAGCNPNRSANTSGQTASRIVTILSRGTIRCSYLVYPPYLLKDANTGKLSGIMFDIMEEIGRGSELKIEWVEEVGYESIFTSVNSGRDDLFCGGLWPNASRVRAGTFSVPVFYSVVKAWGRSDESRFSNLSGINSPDIRIATGGAPLPRAGLVSSLVWCSAATTDMTPGVLNPRGALTFSLSGSSKRFGHVYSGHPAHRP
jgi:ABC-type amino acid transport substrate-binding protein